MRLLTWLLDRLFTKFVITNDVGDQYLIRYKIYNGRHFSIKLHHILRSDEDRELHDHPWNFVSFLLTEGYVELTPGKLPRRWLPWQIVTHKATDAHRLILKHPAWTLVFCSSKVREWRFHTPDGWVHWQKFLDWKFGGRNNYTTETP